jgi:hypothetical protein
VSFTIAPAAQLELIEAAVWYDDIRLRLGTEFLDAIEQVFIELCEMVEEAIETLEDAGKSVPQPLYQHELGSLLQKRA